MLETHALSKNSLGQAEFTKGCTNTSRGAGIMVTVGVSVNAGVVGERVKPTSMREMWASEEQTSQNNIIYSFLFILGFTIGKWRTLVHILTLKWNPPYPEKVAE